MNVDVGRAKRASAILLAFLGLLAVLSFAFAEGERPGRLAQAAESGLSDRDYLRAALAGEDLPQGEMPAWFAEELFVLEGSEAYAEEGSGVFGFVRPASLENCVAEVGAQMEEKGWVLLSASGDTHMSYSRQSGYPTSVVVGFAELEAFTTVVVQVLG